MQLLTPEQLEVATPEELIEYQKALQVLLALQSPLDYAEFVSKETQRYRHVELLNRLIVLLVTGKLRHPVTGKTVRNLAVSMPPRHGKSYLISDHTPPWAITRWARYGFKVGLASYEADFAAEWGRKARQHILDFRDEFGIEIDTTTRAANNWKILPTERGGPIGGMFTAGIGGPLTGKGPHLLVIDDPTKNAEEAMSDTIRNKHYDWWASTAKTRLEPTFIDDEGNEVGHAVLLVNTRWHEDDLQGRILRDSPDDWYSLNLPALAFEDTPGEDPLQREPGEALCPERYDATALNAIKSDPAQGAYWWAALYQGRPNIEGGGIFKRASFRYHSEPRGENAPTHRLLEEPEGEHVYIPRDKLSRFSTLDLAATLKTSADWTVLSTFEVTPDRRLLLIDRVRQRLESADHEAFVLKHFQRLRPLYIGIEKSSFGLTLITHLQRAGVPIRPLEAKGDKISRAIPAGMLTDAGRIYFPKAAPWLEEWENELLQFPNGTHDDQVDTLSYAAKEIATGPFSTQETMRAIPEHHAEARVQRYLDAKDRKRRQHHPDLGRF